MYELSKHFLNYSDFPLVSSIGNIIGISTSTKLLQAFSGDTSGESNGKLVMNSTTRNPYFVLESDHFLMSNIVMYGLARILRVHVSNITIITVSVPLILQNNG